MSEPHVNPEGLDAVIEGAGLDPDGPAAKRLRAANQAQPAADQASPVVEPKGHGAPSELQVTVDF